MKYKYKRRPYVHQKDALKDLLARKWGGALLMEPRTGKTQVCLDFAAILHQGGKVNRVLIVCPVSVMSVWEDEIKAVVKFRKRVTVWDRKGRKKFVLPGFGQDVLDFVIVNYDAFSTPGVMTRNRKGERVRSKRGGRYEIIKRLRAWQPQLMILDESHRIKSSGARKSSGVKMVAWKRSTTQGLIELVPYRIIATGTAVTKKRRSYDIYSQWKFLNPQGWIKDYTLDTFKAEFSVHKSMGNYDRFIKNINEPKLREYIHADSYAVTRDECFDLPPQREQIHLLELEPETARVYDDLVEDMIARLADGEITEAQIRIVLDLRLAQLTSGIVKTAPSVRYPDGQYRQLSTEKLDFLGDRLEDLFEAEEKVVIASRWRPELANIAAMVKRMKVPVYELHGGIGKAERDSNRRYFQARPGPSVFTMQPQAGSLGIDLSTSATMIWTALTQSYVDWTQGNDRIALSPRGTVIEYILARGTIDELRLRALKEDQDLVRFVTRSPQYLRRNYKNGAQA